MNGGPALTEGVSKAVHSAAPTLADRFVRFAAGLCAMLGRRSGTGDPLQPLMFLLSRRVSMVRRRFDRLLALFQAGALPPPRQRPVPKPPPGDAPARPARKESLYPRGVGWLSRIFPPHPEIVYHGRAYGHMLRLLLADPEAEALLRAAPQLVRYLRPLARMLGITDIPALLPPPRVPRPPRPRRAKPPPLDPSVPRPLTDGQVRWLIAHARKVPRDWMWCPATDGRIPSMKRPPDWRAEFKIA